MNIFRALFAALLLPPAAWAQEVAQPLPAAPAAPTSAIRTAEELEQLLGPIALYPDPLIAIILPASTVPTDIVLAARHLRENPGDRTQIEHRAWDESVKSLTNYPEVLQWMDENLQWTQQVGEAFAQQPAEVMQCVQRLRAKARAAGTLVDTPQQQVIAEPEVIRIVPAQPNVIYVPHYEPEVVFVDRPYYWDRPYYYGSFLTFGVGVPVGSWLAFDCDWRRRSIWVGNRHRRWTGHDWRRPVVPIAPGYSYTRTPEVRQWRPAPHSVRTTVTVGNRFRSEIARPAPFGFAASRSHSYRDSGPITRRNDFNSRPATPAQPRNSHPGFRNDIVATRPATVVAPPLPTARDVPAPTPTPGLQPLPQARRSGTDGIRDHQRTYGNSNSDNRTRGAGEGVRDYRSRSTVGAVPDYGNHSRSFRSGSQEAVISAAPPVTLAQPASPRTIQRDATTSHRPFNHSPSSTAAPARPMQNRSVAPAAVAPVVPQTAPAPQAAPAAAPQAAPAQRSEGESRGHRGAILRRGF